MAHLNVGFNWDKELVTKLIDLNERANEGVVIGSIYGSTVDNPLGSARPLHRLPHVTIGDVMPMILDLAHYGIDTNYTMNVSSLGDLKDFTARKPQILGFLKRLQGIVPKITVAHPLVLELIHENDLMFDVEISTIMNVDTLGHFLFYRDQFPKVTSICLALSRNRDFGFLNTLGKGVYNLNIPEPELLVNEFCNVGGHNCQGVYRSSCYECHSHNVRDAENNYPMSRCTASRWPSPESWLKARFILPQWLNIYENLGILKFKISGRTHNSEYILNTIKAYMSCQFDGNLLELWAHLESIWGGHDEQLKAITRVNIPCSKIEESDFFSKWSLNFKFRCAEQFCGENCTYCKEIYNGIAASNRHS